MRRATEYRGYGMSSPTSAGALPAVAGEDPRLPNLFVIGAPKSGTTFLHGALGRVPTVYMSSVKEPGFFTSDRDQRRGLEYYLAAFFAKAGGHTVRGESTPWYLYSDVARQRIAALPAAEVPKLLVMVRLPGDRALSMYCDQVRLNRESRSFADAVAVEVAAIEAGHVEPDVRRRYVWGGLYSEHIERWRATFGSDNLHVVVLEELTADPTRAWRDIATFLGHDLGPVRFGDVSEQEWNRGGSLRWPRVDAFIRSFEGRNSPLVEGAKRVLPPGFHRRVLQQVGRVNRGAVSDRADRVSKATLDSLDDFYRPEVERLETLLGRPLTVWSPETETLTGAARASDVPLQVLGEGTDPRTMRILHLVARSHRRGAEQVALELANELDRRGHHNRVVALGPASGGGHEAGLFPLVGSRGMGLFDLITRVRSVRRLLAEEPVDVVLAHGGWAAQIVALAAPRGGPILVWQRILGFPPEVWGPGRRRWWQAIARRFDVGVALTADLEAELRRLGFDGPVWIIPNSRQPDRFLDLDRTEAATRLRTEVGVAKDVALIGFVGHLVHQKRPERAIEVLARVLDRGRSAHLVIAGDGELRSELELDVRNRGLTHSVTFLGHRDDVEWVLGAVELTLLTSDTEGIPGVAIESLMAGCPVITFPVGGVCEVVDDGVTGVVLDRHDQALMAEAVLKLLDDDDTRRAMGREGRLQTARFSASATAEIYAERLAALLDVP